MRCIALAEALMASGVEPVFAMRDTTDLVRDALDLRGLRRISLGDADTEILGEVDDARAVVDACNRIGDVAVAVVDSYALGQDWSARLRASGRRVVVIDDLHDRDIDADVVLNTAPHVSSDAYAGRVVRGTTLLLGCRFALLRREFEGLRGVARRRACGSDRVLVSYGGGDVGAISSATVEALSVHPARPVRIDVVGPPHERVPTAMMEVEVHWHGASHWLAEMAADCTAAFGSAGVSAIERLYLGVPAACACLAENQRPSLDWLVAHSMAHRLDPLDSDAIAVAADALLRGASRRWFDAPGADALFGDEMFPTRRTAAAILELTHV